MGKVKIFYIRVDSKRGIFMGSNPGIAKLDEGDDVQDIILEAAKYDPSLQAIPLKKIEVYKLKTPIAALPRRGTRSTDPKKAAFQAVRSHQ